MIWNRLAIGTTKRERSRDTFGLSPQSKPMPSNTMQKSQDFARLVMDAVEQMRPLLRDELLRDVDVRIEGFRRAVYIREDWCCNEMRRFAIDTWGAAKPRTEVDSHFGNVAYQLRGHAVNYCPFCGVAFIKASATA